MRQEGRTLTLSSSWPSFVREATIQSHCNSRALLAHGAKAREDKEEGLQVPMGSLASRQCQPLPYATGWPGLHGPSPPFAT